MSYAKRRRKTRHKRKLTARCSEKSALQVDKTAKDLPLSYIVKELLPMSKPAIYDDIRICCDCISDGFLREQIFNSEQVFECTECGEVESPSIKLTDLADKIHEVLIRHFDLTREYPEGYECYQAKEGEWEREGDMLDQVIMDLVGVSDARAEEMIEYLSSLHDAQGKDALCDPQLYSIDPYYAEKPLETYEFSESWRSFKKSVYQEARFFNDHAKKMLDHIFDGVDAVSTLRGAPVIRDFAEETIFYRSRVALSQDALKDILKTLPSSIGPPNSDISRSGRMNAQGISMFYGALDKSTCLAEVRAPVGSHVVTGGFSPIRNLRLLDLSRL